MIITYRYRLKDKRAAKHLREQAIACNQVWNWLVAQHRDSIARYRAGAKRRRWPSSFDLQKECNGVGAMLGIYQQAADLMCRQFVHSRDAVRRPLRFRTSFGPRRSLGWVPFRRMDTAISGNSILYLRKRYRWFGNKKRPLPATAESGAFVEDSLGRWWITFRVEVDEREASATQAVGIDLGLKSFATMSNGRKIRAPQHFRSLEAKLATAQRAGNPKQAKRIHLKIANSRKDFLHKLSTSLVRENALIAVGNVSSSKLARTRMAKSVMDAGWSAFRLQLRYKSQKAGVAYLEVDERFTTQTCSSCGCLPPERPKGIAGLGIRAWDCSDCGASHDRDVNAAKNILRLGLSAQPRVDESRRAA